MNSSRGWRRYLTVRTGLLITALVAVVAAVAIPLGLRGHFGKSGGLGSDRVGASKSPAEPSASADSGLSTASPVPSASKPAASPSSRRPGTPASGWPNETNTGVPANRKLLSSNAVRVTKPGTVIDGLDVHGDISVEADNVTIKNTRVITQGNWAIIQRDNAKGLIVQDCDIRGNGRDRLQHAVLNFGGMVTVQRTDMSIVSDAISTNIGMIVDNYLHDPKYFADDHTDMIQSNAGSDTGKLIIRHNTVINTIDQTSAIALFQDFGVQHDAVIENNLLAGGGYALYAGAGSKGKSFNIRVVNNTFSRNVFPKGGNFGPVAYWEDGAGNVWEGNVWDTGEPVTP